MAFSSEVKKELLEAQRKKKCCRKAFLRGLLFDAREEDDLLRFRTQTEESANGLLTLAHELLGVEGDLSSSVLMSHIHYEVTLPAAVRQKLEGGNTCEHCATSWLCGVFAATATVSDPLVSYHLEFMIHEATRAGELYTFLVENGMPPKIVNRKHAVGIYFKNSTAIEELLTFLGATHSVFTFINSKIEREIRNNENRATNCVAKNIAKTVNASRKSVAAIQRLIYSGRFELLPEDLYTTAKLRIENPDMSLVELAALHEPPISKSGLTHRLRKIEAEAEKIK